MDSSQETSLIRRLGRLVGRTVLTAAAVAVSLYATRRQPAPEKNHEASADEPAKETEGSTTEETDEEPRAEEAPAEGEAQEATGDETEESEEFPDEIGEDESGGEETSTEGAAEESVREVAVEEPGVAEAPAEDESEASEESADKARPLEDLTADELYPVAQQLDITGRATMNQAQLVEALQAEGVNEVADGEPVVEDDPAENESEASEESTDEARPLEELTADELYPVAQQLDITGRATMDQEQLVEALRAEGIYEVADGEPVVEDTPDEDEAEEQTNEVADAGETTSTDESTVEGSHETNAVRPLDELTASELYRVAQRLEIAGRSTMRKAQLVKALQAEGIDEAEI